MANEPGGFTGADLFARGIGQGGKAKTDDYVNGENAMAEHTKAAMDKAADAVKSAVPFVGKAALIFSGVSATAGLESEGLAGKPIMPGMLPDAQGGVLARIGAQLLKGGVQITDHTGGVGGDHRGEGAGELYTNHVSGGESATTIEAPVITAAAPISSGGWGRGGGE